MNQDMYWFLIEAKYRYQKLDAISLTKMNQYRNMNCIHNSQIFK